MDETILAFVSQTNPLINDTASAITSAVIAADLQLLLVDDQDPVGFGEIVYTATIQNNGPLAASNVVIDSELFVGTLSEDPTLPNGLGDLVLSFNSVTPSQGSCEIEQDTILCTLGLIPSGGTATITMVVDPPDRLLTVTNVGTVGADEDDTNFGNNSTSETTLVEVFRLLLPIIRR